MTLPILIAPDMTPACILFARWPTDRYVLQNSFKGVFGTQDEKHRNNEKRRNRKGTRMQNRGMRNRGKLKEQLFRMHELEYKKWSIIYLLLKGDCKYA
jgi:hypothetical protein